MDSTKQLIIKTLFNNTDIDSIKNHITNYISNVSNVYLLADRLLVELRPKYIECDSVNWCYMIIKQKEKQIIAINTMLDIVLYLFPEINDYFENAN